MFANDLFWDPSPMVEDTLKFYAGTFENSTKINWKNTEMFKLVF